LTCIDDNDNRYFTNTGGTGSKYLEYNPGSELNIFLMKNENQIEKRSE
jgi:hypothetical protein